MNDETAREKLAAAIPEWTGLCDEEFLYLADALLPVVREIVAEAYGQGRDDEAHDKALDPNWLRSHSPEAAS